MGSSFVPASVPWMAVHREGVDARLPFRLRRVGLALVDPVQLRGPGLADNAGLSLAAVSHACGPLRVQGGHGKRLLIRGSLRRQQRRPAHLHRLFFTHVHHLQFRRAHQMPYLRDRARLWLVVCGRLRPLDVCRKPLLLRHLQCLPVCTHGLPRGGVDGGVRVLLGPICVCQQLLSRCARTAAACCSATIQIGMCGVPSMPSSS